MEHNEDVWMVCEMPQSEVSKSSVAEEQRLIQVKRLNYSCLREILSKTGTSQLNSICIAPNANLQGKILSSNRIARFQILTIHSDHILDQGRSKIKSRVLRNQYVEMYKSENIDFHITNSTSTSSHIGKYLGLVDAPLKIREIPHPPIPVPKIEMNDEVQLNQPYLLFIGKRISRKGSLKLARLWIRAVRKKYVAPEFNLYFVGAKGHEDKWIKLLLLIFRFNNLNLCHEVDDMTKWSFITNAEAVIVPSRYESYSLVINEALSLGRPVITFDLPWALNHLARESLTIIKQEPLSLSTAINNIEFKDSINTLKSISAMFDVEFEKFINEIREVNCG